jgi:hypothetical protein
VGLGDDEEGVAGDADAGDAGDSSRVRAPALA